MKSVKNEICEQWNVCYSKMCEQWNVWTMKYVNNEMCEQWNMLTKKYITGATAEIEAPSSELGKRQQIGKLTYSDIIGKGKDGTLVFRWISWIYYFPKI